MMDGIRGTGYAAGLGALLLAGALAFGGVAMAASNDDDGGSGHNGANGRNGTATTYCNQRVSTDIYAPVQCQATSSSYGNARGTNGTDGATGSHGDHRSKDSDSRDSDRKDSDRRDSDRKDSDRKDSDGRGSDSRDTGSNSSDSKDSDGQSSKGADGADGKSTYTNPVTQERHFIPLPNIG